jgi:hypothetical protein
MYVHDKALAERAVVYEICIALSLKYLLRERWPLKARDTQLQLPRGRRADWVLEVKYDIVREAI